MSLLGSLLHPMQQSSPEGNKIIIERLRTFGDKAHVKALREIIDIIRAPRAVLGMAKAA
jgi:hypothetical protein